MKRAFNFIYLILCVLSTFVFLSSCNDDDEFSTSTSDQLTFEADTIRFDTVITTVGSSTKRFKVFNNNDKAIRMSSVRLASGGESGFRINVDGHSGNNLTDIEILRKDSIFIFAEVTLNVQNADEPVYVSDDLIFTLENGNSQKIVLEAYGQDAIMLHAPVIEEDTEWNETKPFIIYDSLIVKNGATLTIAEGTTLCFHQGAYMGVYGSVQSNGSLEEPVVFRGDRTDRIFSYLPYDRMDAQWEGILLYPESKNNIFNYVDIHGGNYGIDCPLSTADDYKFLIQNTVIHNVARNGLRSYYALGQVINSQISNAGENCVNLIGGHYLFVHTTISQFYPWNADHGAALHFTNVLNDTIYPIEQAKFSNCLITGGTTDEIVGNRLENSDAAFNVSFDNCLVNIKMDDNAPEEIKQMFVTSVNETGNTKDWSKNTDGSYSDDIIWGMKNFRLIDNEVFAYDFHLDEKSRARGIGNSDYANYCPVDLSGVPRPSSKPDAGCFQFVSLP